MNKLATIAIFIAATQALSLESETEQAYEYNQDVCDARTAAI